MIRLILLFIFIIYSFLEANTRINLKDGSLLEGDVAEVHRTVLKLKSGHGIMLKLISSIQTNDTSFVQDLRLMYPQLTMERNQNNDYLLDFSNLNITTAAQVKKEERPLIQSYSFSAMINSQKRHLYEINARLFTRYTWTFELGISFGDESFPETVYAREQYLQADFSTVSFGIGAGKSIDIKIGKLLPALNCWISTSDAVLPPLKYMNPDWGDSLTLRVNVNEIIFSPGITFFKIDKSELIMLMVGVRYYFDGIMLGDRGWWIDEVYYPVDKSMLKRGWSVHFGIGINLKAK